MVSKVKSNQMSSKTRRKSIKKHKKSAKKLNEKSNKDSTVLFPDDNRQDSNLRILSTPQNKREGESL